MEKLKIEDTDKLRNSIIKINTSFIEYYRNLLPMNPLIFEEFLQISNQKLPITFRVNRIYNLCEFLDCELQTIINKLHLDKSIKRFNWNGLDNIYELSELDKIKDKDLKSLLVRENDLGILRQELVSMIPVSLVEIQEDSVVMDMCAAPGNKSVQVLEIMQEKGREKGILATGVLISNELDYRRGIKLVHLLQSQPTINVISTLCPAQEFPKIKNEDYQPNIVFCDVPCSGDGTLRKNKGLRKRWKPEYGFKNHQLQIEILENSLRLCKIGGHVVYSTCSINPIENEAVVAFILKKYKDSIELVDISSKIKNNLKINYSEGLVKWKVAYDWKDYKNILWAYDFSQVTKNKTIIKESMFDEVYTKKNHQNNIYFGDPLNLRRCARFYSNQNNSGSFFVAVIKKKNEILIDTETSMNLGQSMPLNKKEFKIKNIGDELDEMIEFLEVDDDKKEKVDNLENKTDKLDLDDSLSGKEENIENKILSFDKFVKFKEYIEKLKLLKEFYNFKNNDIFDEQLHSLRTTSSKILLFSKKLSEIIKILCDMNLNVLHAGLVCFSKERKNLPGKYRLSHYGGIILESFITNQKYELKISEFNKKFIIDLIDKKKIKFDEIQPEIKNILNFQMGSLLLIYDSVVILCRKGHKNLSVMIPDIQLENLSIYLKKYLN